MAWSIGNKILDYQPLSTFDDFTSSKYGIINVRMFTLENLHANYNTDQPLSSITVCAIA